MTENITDQWNEYNDAKDAHSRIEMNDASVSELARKVADEWPAYQTHVLNPHIGDLAEDVCNAHCAELGVPAYHFADGTIGQIQFAAEEIMGVTEAQRRGY